VTPKETWELAIRTCEQVAFDLAARREKLKLAGRYPGLPSLGEVDAQLVCARMCVTALRAEAWRAEPESEGP
jgi:hypothetical protein